MLLRCRPETGMDGFQQILLFLSFFLIDLRVSKRHNAVQVSASSGRRTTSDHITSFEVYKILVLGRLLNFQLWLMELQHLRVWTLS